VSYRCQHQGCVTAAGNFPVFTNRCASAAMSRYLFRFLHASPRRRLQGSCRISFTRIWWIKCDRLPWYNPVDTNSVNLNMWRKNLVSPTFTIIYQSGGSLESGHFSRFFRHAGPMTGNCFVVTNSAWLYHPLSPDAAEVVLNNPWKPHTITPMARPLIRYRCTYSIQPPLWEI